MKPAELASFVTLSLFASRSFALSSQAHDQSVLSADNGATAEMDHKAYVEGLLAIHDNDPVAAMKVADPVYGAMLDEPRLLEIFGQPRQWMTEGDKLRLKQEGLSFIDLTNFEEFEVDSAFAEEVKSWPDIHQQTKVNEAVSLLNVDNLRKNLGTLTSFYNRFYRSEYGVKSSRWIFDQVVEIVTNAPPSTRLSLETFPHSFPQSSVIARFEPTGGRASSSSHQDVLPRIIIGAHQDSANYKFPMLPAPGADDDGSGTVTILEAFRTLVEAGFKPAAPVEFHWYAAEEGGLLGSQEVVKEYVALGKKVGAMVQFDMTGYVKPGTTPAVTLITTDVHPSLTNWTLSLAEEYCDSAVQGAKLFPGAGSDHMSWHRAGFASTFATEAEPFKDFNPYIHTVDDRLDLEDDAFSFEHALEFSKLAIGFAVELGGWMD